LPQRLQIVVNLAARGAPEAERAVDGRMQRPAGAEIDKAEDRRKACGRDDEIIAGRLAAGGERADQILAEPRLRRGEILAAATFGVGTKVVAENVRECGTIGQTEQAPKTKLQQQPSLNRRLSHASLHKGGSSWQSALF
jgi:hypothetical protein